jgi:hypothetical protein
MVHLEDAGFLSNNASMTADVLTDIIKNTSHIMNGYIKTDHQNYCLTFVENVLEKKYVEAYPELTPRGKRNNEPAE